MTEDFWKRFPPIPGFDCLKMKRDIQAEIHRETKNMSQEQRLQYYRDGAKKLRPSGSAIARRDEPMAVREEPAAYKAKSRRKD